MEDILTINIVPIESSITFMIELLRFENLELEVYNSHGEWVDSILGEENLIVLDKEEFKKGKYFYHLKGDNICIKKGIITI